MRKGISYSSWSATTKVTQADAKPACSGFHDTTAIPPIGAHVAIMGTFVTEKNHGKWNEIHPVSRIAVQ